MTPREHQWDTRLPGTGETRHWSRPVCTACGAVQGSLVGGLPCGGPVRISVTPYSVEDEPCETLPT